MHNVKQLCSDVRLYTAVLHPVLQALLFGSPGLALSRWPGAASVRPALRPHCGLSHSRPIRALPSLLDKKQNPPCGGLCFFGSPGLARSRRSTRLGQAGSQATLWPDSLPAYSSPTFFIAHKTKPAAWRALFFGSPGRARTYNPSVNSRMLCH